MASAGGPAQARIVFFLKVTAAAGVSVLGWRSCHNVVAVGRANQKRANRIHGPVMLRTRSVIATMPQRGGCRG